MKMSSLSFADYVAIEALTALIPLSRFFTEDPEQDMARVAYKHADALDAERKRRDGIVDHDREALERRLAKAENSVSVLLNMNEDGNFAPRVALSDIWELLGAKNQTDAMAKLHDFITDAKAGS